MRHLTWLCALAAFPQEEVTFRSDVNLVRVDAQVVDRSNRAITGLTAADFVVRERGEVREIKSFAAEDMPLDVLFLIDVSGSMRPHVERVAAASDAALRLLNKEDRIALLVFDRRTRVRMPFRQNRRDLPAIFDNLLRDENFGGGTDITRALYDAVRYMAQNARKDARRSIVILTDDRTEFEADVAGIGADLAEADTVLSAIIAPDAIGRRGPVVLPGGWPGQGGVIIGRRRGPVITSGDHTRSAGTARIARESGGESVPVDDPGALESALESIRQRYSLFYSLPEGSTGPRFVEVTLAAGARRRYPDADVRYRRGSQAGEAPSGPMSVSRAPAAAPPPLPPPDEETGWRREEPAGARRRPAISEPSRGAGPMVKDPDPRPEAAGKPAGEARPAATKAEDAPAPSAGGWRRVTDPEPPPPEKPEPPPVRKKK
jgi:VWFA-related protein